MPMARIEGFREQKQEVVQVELRRRETRQQLQKAIAENDHSDHDVLSSRGSSRDPLDMQSAFNHAHCLFLHAFALKAHEHVLKRKTLLCLLMQQIAFQVHDPCNNPTGCKVAFVLELQHEMLQQIV